VSAPAPHRSPNRVSLSPSQNSILFRTLFLCSLSLSVSLLLSSGALKRHRSWLPCSSKTDSYSAPLRGATKSVRTSALNKYITHSLPACPSHCHHPHCVSLPDPGSAPPPLPSSTFVECPSEPPGIGSPQPLPFLRIFTPHLLATDPYSAPVPSQRLIYPFLLEDRIPTPIPLRSVRCSFPVRPSPST